MFVIQSKSLARWKNGKLWKFVDESQHIYKTRIILSICFHINLTLKKLNSGDDTCVLFKWIESILANNTWKLYLFLEHQYQPVPSFLITVAILVYPYLQLKFCLCTSTKTSTHWCYLMEVYFRLAKSISMKEHQRVLIFVTCAQAELEHHSKLNHLWE